MFMRPNFIRAFAVIALCVAGLLCDALGGDNGNPLLGQARQYWSEKKYEQAVEAYRKLRDEFPQHEFVRSGGAQFWLWCSLGNAGKTEEQVAEIERFLKDYPQHASCGYALYFLGTAWRRLGDEAKARQAWERLLREHPDDKMARYAKDALEGRGAQEQPVAAKSARTLGTDFVDGAAEAARWLKGIAEEKDGGLAWTSYEGSKGHALSFYKGSAGICLFFLNMYRITGKQEYADLAKKSAAGLMRLAVKDEGGLCWEDEEEPDDDSLTRRRQPGLYTGAAGIGHVFLCLHREFGEDIYLAHARGAADWIVATAEKQKALCRWRQDADIIAGAAGIGLFLLEMHEATGEKKYLDCAVGAAEWLISQAVKEDGTLKWKSTPSLDRFYTGFSHGTAGVSYFLAKVYERTKQKRFLEQAAAGAEWLMKNAASDGQGAKWFHYKPGHEKEFMTGWCHGPAGTCRLFLELHRLTGEDKYLDMAKKGAAWLMNSLDPAGKGDGFFGLSMCCGAAGIGDFFLDLFLATNDEAYLEYAGRIAEFLIVQAKTSESGWKWTNHDVPDKAGKVYYGTGHMIGAAGVGSLFLKMHAVLNHREDLFIPFADKPAAKASAQKAQRHSYVILTDLPENDPYFAAARRLAAQHDGMIVPFDPKQMFALRRRLTQLNPRYVALVLRPQDIDVNLQRQMLALSTRMDDDPFCDFAFGFVTGATAQDALSLVERGIRAQKEGLPKTMITASVTSGQKSFVSQGLGTPLAAQLGYEGKAIYWSCAGSDPQVRDFVKEHIENLQKKGIVMLTGNGDPEGIWLFSDRRNLDASRHWPFDPQKVGYDPKGEMPRITAEYFRGLDLGGAVVWSGTCHSGVLHRAFVENDIVSTFGKVDKVTEYVIPAGRSLGLAILSDGPSAYLAPIGPNHGYACNVELYRALSTGWALGDVMRSRYNEIILDAGGRLDVALYEPGASFPAENMMRGGGANRTLFGDPLFKPFPEAGRDYLGKKVASLPDRKGLRVTCEVVDEASFQFWDMFGDDRGNPERIYTTIELPQGMATIGDVSGSAKSPDGKKIPVTGCKWAVEKIDGKRIAHLHVNASRGILARKGTTVEFVIISTQ